MIAAMPAAAPDNAPHPRRASWLLGGAVVVASAALLATSAWAWLPLVAPKWVAAHSPWTTLVVRACVAMDRDTHYVQMTLRDWATNQVPNGCESLAPFLASRDHETRRIVVATLSMMTAAPRGPSFDLWLMPLLSDPDPVIRADAVMALTDPATIPYLERMRSDPAQRVVGTIDLTLDRLRRPRPTPAR